MARVPIKGLGFSFAVRVVVLGRERFSGSETLCSETLQDNISPGAWSLGQNQPKPPKVSLCFELLRVQEVRF